MKLKFGRDRDGVEKAMKGETINGMEALLREIKIQDSYKLSDKIRIGIH